MFEERLSSAQLDYNKLSETCSSCQLQLQKSVDEHAQLKTNSSAQINQLRQECANEAAQLKDTIANLRRRNQELDSHQKLLPDKDQSKNSAINRDDPVLQQKSHLDDFVPQINEPVEHVMRHIPEQSAVKEESNFDQPFVDRQFAKVDEQKENQLAFQAHPSNLRNLHDSSNRTQLKSRLDASGYHKLAEKNLADNSQIQLQAVAPKVINAKQEDTNMQAGEYAVKNGWKYNAKKLQMPNRNAAHGLLDKRKDVDAQGEQITKSSASVDHQFKQKPRKEKRIFNDGLFQRHNAVIDSQISHTKNAKREQALNQEKNNN